MTAEPHIAPPTNPPALNIPGTVQLIALLLLGVHVVRTYALSPDQDYWLLNVFAFVPLFYEVDATRLVEPLSRFWSPVTHGLLHGDWTHLIVNLVWMVAFGSAVARRFLTWRFLVFVALATAAGALAHYPFHIGSNAPVIGASGAVSACMGAAVRFAFTPGQAFGQATYAPALSLGQSLRNPNILAFLGIWFALNWLFGAGIIDIGANASIAWQAHIGGFLFGWLAFTLFDKPKHQVW